MKVEKIGENFTWRKFSSGFNVRCESFVRDFLVLFSVFVRQKVTVNKKITFTDYPSGIQLPDCSKFAVSWKNGNNVTVFRHDIIVKNFWRYFFLMSISSLVLKLWPFPFIKDWAEIRKSELHPSEFCRISGDWGELEYQI